MIKKPSNRHALPKVIISKVDNQNILEFKIKYKKLSRLDRVEIKTMHYDDRAIVFDEVIINGGLIDVEYRDNHKTIFVKVGDKSYSISGQKVGGKERLLENRISQTKVQLELKDEATNRVSKTERELIVDDNIKLYSQIVGRDVKTTKDIYLIKRFLGYRSDLLFYYGFVNNFFHVANNRPEFWKIDFNDNRNSKLIEYFIFTINDHLKNDENYLKDYISDRGQIVDDLENIKHIFSALRHGLMHFDYDFFEALFNGEDIDIKMDNQGNTQPLSSLNIKFLDIMIDKLDKLNIDTKKEFIDAEKITIFGEELSLAKLYRFYAHTAINRVAFNKLINSFIIENGVENQSLKEYFNQQAGGIAYEIDIHQNREYKNLYNEHKKLVSRVLSISDGQEIATLNQKIVELKEQMKQITKINSIKRLEYKLRLAFGFIYTEYKNYEEFKNSFDTDIKNGRFTPKDEDGNKRAFDSRELEHLKGYYKATLQTQKPQTDEKMEEVSKRVDRLSLKSLIGDDTLLKFILLMFTFMPQELKGEFLGFIKKYYHDTKHIDQDTISDSDDTIEEGLSIGLKLKILDKNIRSLSILKHSLSFQTKYNKKDRSYYEDGNIHGKFFKKLGISHNQEEFNKSVYAPLFRYYSALYKLINDFEIYTLSLHIVGNETLSDQVNKPQFLSGRYFNFRKLLTQSYNISNNSTHSVIFNAVINMRNDISHLSYEPLLDCPLNGKKSYKRKIRNQFRTINIKPLVESRKMIIDFITLQTDMQKVLGCDAVNDFTMKIVQLRTRLKAYANKEQTIEKMITEAKTPNDFYNIYKVKGVEAINKYLLEVIGETQVEKEIREEIERGNIANS